MGRYSGQTCRLIFMLTATGIFFIAELVAGYMGNSIALVSDSFNMLSDVISLSVGLIAARVRRRPSSARCSYGLVRVEVLGAWANAVFLFAVRLSVSAQALQRLAVPEAIDNPRLVLVVGAIGLGVNVVGLLVFQDWGSLCRRRAPRVHQDIEPKSDANPEAGFQQEDLHEDDEIQDEGHHLNIRGVLLHMFNDALGSVVVVVTSVLFYIWPLESNVPCNWQCYVDPSLTLIMVAIIMPTAIPLVRETATILLQVIPRGLPFRKILEEVCTLPGVLSVHDAHLWELTKGLHVASLHVRVSTELQSSLSGIKTLHRQIRDVFHRFGIHSVTVQLEFGDGSLEKSYCSTPCSSPSCLKLSCCPPDAAGLPVCIANPAVYSGDFTTEKHDMSSVLKEQEAKQLAKTYQTRF
ncbi:calcium/manganese antiporter SLC30A10-like [Trichomycterus rosablanca]|uniref:calcium/manganese antiporter SLC30A10-like n=1 Tax=Trichomycterus rosablanca TaxID=2290929 RepID=UPI002F356534